MKTRVKSLDEDGWIKLCRKLLYLKGTMSLPLTLEANRVMNLVLWWVDASFAVHPGFKSRTGGIMPMGKGAIMDLSKKQK